MGRNVPPAMPVGTDYSNWQYSLSLVINTKDVGVTEDVSNFPLLVRLTPENAAVFNTAKNNGEDIRFSKSDGSTPLPYQIEKWDNISQQATIWVKVDVIYGNNDEQAIIMYYGNSAASSESNDANVFGSIDYSGVWHLNDMDDASRPSGSDYDGTNNGTAYIQGIIGDGVKFEGADWIDISTAAFSGVSSQITMEFWSYGGTGMPKDSRLVWSRDSYGNRTLNVVLPWSDESVTFDAGNSGCYFNRIENLATASEYKGTWGHWVFTKDGSTGAMRIYYNGALWFSEESGNTYQLHIQNGFRIGADNCGSLNWEGRLDEFRVSKTMRSAAWVKLSYESQKQIQALVEFGFQCQTPHDCVRATGPEYPPFVNPCDSMRVDDKIFLWPKNINFGETQVPSFNNGHFIQLYNDDKFYPGTVSLPNLPKEPSFNIKIPIPESPGGFAHYLFDNDGVEFKTPFAWDTTYFRRYRFDYNGFTLNNSETPERFFRFSDHMLQIHDTINDAYISLNPIEDEIRIQYGPNSTLVTSSHIRSNTVYTQELWVKEGALPDFVFEKGYDLKSLYEIEAYITKNKHLPGIPSQGETEEKGLSVGNMQSKLLEKIEEMTLHMINMQKRVDELEKELKE